jgi:acetyl-CoA C-acetyltransferase
MLWIATVLLLRLARTGTTVSCAPTMAVPPRTPVLVGAAQLSQRAEDPALAREPIVLMRDALRAAAEDAGAPALLAQADSIRVTQGFHDYGNPAAWLAGQLGAASPQTVLATISGTGVQQMIDDAAAGILAGRRDVVLIAGGEAERSARRLKRAGGTPERTKVDAPPPDLVVGERAADWRTNPDISAGLHGAPNLFALFETALRHHLGLDVAAHRARIGALWARFAAVAAANPDAWVRSAPSAEQIAAPGEGNPWVSYPYTKLLVANAAVDQAAALILCSAEAARRAGVPESRWVYLVAATEAVVVRHVSERVELFEEPPLRIAGPRALELAGVEAAALDFVDLYSCFPVAVQLAAEALGLPLERPLTVTGGLTFAGGPLNSYVIHAIATTMARLRERPDATALVSSVGGFFSKHAFGVYAGHPPAAPFRCENLAGEVRALPRRVCDLASVGPARVEAYTIAHPRSRPPHAVLAVRTPEETRSWARSSDPSLLAALEREDWVGREVRVREDRGIEA